MPMSNTTKVLLGVGAAGVAGFILWRLFKTGEEVADGDLVTPSDWGGWNMSTGDAPYERPPGSGTSGPEQSNPLEQFAQPKPQGSMSSPGTGPDGHTYIPGGPAQTIASSFAAPRNPIGTEPNKSGPSTMITHPCAGVICPPNHVCVAVGTRYKCINIE